MNQTQQQVFLCNRLNLLSGPSILENSILTSRFCIKMSLAWNFIFESPGSRRLHLLLRVALPLRIRHESKGFYVIFFYASRFPQKIGTKKFFRLFRPLRTAISRLFFSFPGTQDRTYSNSTISFNLGLLSIPRTKGRLTYENGKKGPKNVTFSYICRGIFFFPDIVSLVTTSVCSFLSRPRAKKKTFFPPLPQGTWNIVFNFALLHAHFCGKGRRVGGWKLFLSSSAVFYPRQRRRNNNESSFFSGELSVGKGRGVGGWQRYMSQVLGTGKVSSSLQKLWQNKYVKQSMQAFVKNKTINSYLYISN